MVEFAVAVQSQRDLPLVESPWASFAHQNPIETEMQTIFFEEWERLYEKKRKPDRIYFGSEFCQYRLPSLSTVKKALAYSWHNGFEFTFASPYVHNQKFHLLLEILEDLHQTAGVAGRSIEVVLNDWGVYHHVRTNFPSLHIVIGRLLNKTIRDPRIADYYDDERAPESARNVVKETGLFSDSFSRFLESANVVGIEFDELVQEHKLAQHKSPYRLSFHFPFGCVASGNACMVGFMEASKKEKFRGDPECKQQCQLYTFELKNRQFTDMEYRIFQKGNTAFYAYNPNIVKRGLQGMIDVASTRIVYSPRIPV
ncbi:hypothetical protein [Aneurinibacillus sp. UBA3580]|jgi:hypothetical protein|uniref:hypothetical protein n=1 Tax=Aneurinibacillus sp. UBA3580 TaxID=1946041 RepID=UPI00257CA46F|nr:hypothetical protein [Aneurinibacillus sp. UBA3580]